MSKLPTSNSAFRVRIAILVLCGILTLSFLTVASQFVRTLSQLDIVEAERDRWQRPSEIVSAMNLQAGNVVADLGCGSGYFSLKLSSAVGGRGKVLAVDIRRLPLIFLWARTFEKNLRNVHVMHDEPDNPQLPSQTVNAVLIANTYHELPDSQPILDNVMRSLIPGGRLVVVDPAPKANEEEHHVDPSSAEAALRRSRFEIVNRQDRFIDDPDNGLWWLIVARNPRTQP